MGVTLSELCELIVDSEHKTAPVANEGYPMIRTPNVGEGRFLLDGVRRVDDETYETWTRRAEPRAGDLILAREAPVGNVAMVPLGMRPILGQRTVLLRPDRTKVEPAYLQYRLLGREAQHRMWSLSNGATVPHLNMKDIRGLEIAGVPSLSEQRKIAAALTAYDELIENNLRRIEILEGMARSIYREWFVNFRYSGHEDEELVDSPLGPIPTGWTVESLFDVAEVSFGFAFKSAMFTEEEVGEKVIRIRDIPKNTSATFTEEPADERYRVHDGDVLIGMDGDFHMCVWSDGPAMLNQRVTRIRPRHALPVLFLFHALRRPISHLNSTITGTTVAHLGKRHLKAIQLVIPSASVSEKSAVLFEDILELDKNLRRQNKTLRETRDLLLPKLVSGELDVSDLEIDTSWLAA